jgi:hypothetical protein
MSESKYSQASELDWDADFQESVKAKTQKLGRCQRWRDMPYSSHACHEGIHPEAPDCDGFREIPREPRKSRENDYCLHCLERYDKRVRHRAHCPRMPEHARLSNRLAELGYTGK